MTKTIYLSAAALIMALSAPPAAQAAMLDNGLSFNGRNMNGLSFNGRNMNGLSLNGSGREEAGDQGAAQATTIILKDGEEVTLR